MIVEWFLGVAVSLFHSLMGALPVATVPAWLSDSSGAMATVFSAAGSMGVWFNAQLLIVVLGAVLALWLVGFSIKLVRIVASFLTAGGGSAA